MIDDRIGIRCIPGDRTPYVHLSMTDYDAIRTRTIALEASLRSAVNRLRNQGGDISEITYEANMLVAREAEAILYDGKTR